MSSTLHSTQTAASQEATRVVVRLRPTKANRSTTAQGCINESHSQGSLQFQGPDSSQASFQFDKVYSGCADTWFAGFRIEAETSFAYEAASHCSDPVLTVSRPQGFLRKKSIKHVLLHLLQALTRLNRMCSMIWHMSWMHA
jgi:hypothetical protein